MIPAAVEQTMPASASVEAGQVVTLAKVIRLPRRPEHQPEAAQSRSVSRRTHEAGPECSCEDTRMSVFANPLAPRRARPEKARRIKSWVRELYELAEDVVVSVTELACRDQGCPGIETVIGIMRPGQKIETVRVHKPIAEISEIDLRPPET